MVVADNGWLGLRKRNVHIITDGSTRSETIRVASYP